MRFIIYGAGAIGGVIGGQLFRHGHDTVLIARGDHHDAIAKSGLRLETPEGSYSLPIPIAGHPNEVSWQAGDVVVLAMKTQDTSAALNALVAAAPLQTPIVCAQNGVDNERQALRRFPLVYGMLVACPATFLKPGVVEAHAGPITGLLDVGRYPRGTDETAQTIATVLESSTFDSRVFEDVMRWKYRKLLSNLGNALDALVGYADRQSEVGRLATEEGAACLRAAGIDVASAEEDKVRRGDIVLGRAAGGEGGSTWQSLQRRLPTVETDYLNGEIVLLGRIHGVPTPVNEMLQALVAEAARSGAAPRQLNQDDLLARLSS